MWIERKDDQSFYQLQLYSINMDSPDLKKIFDEFDLDNNGTISLSELGTVAAKLGSPLNSEELTDIKDLLDTNRDGKISFKEFEYWWNKGHKGKLSYLVYLKAKAMKLTNFIKAKFSQADITLENHKGNPNPDRLDFSVEFGEPAHDCLHVGFSLYSRGKGQNLERQKVKMLLGKMGDHFDENSMGIVVKLPSQNPSMAKASFEKLLNDIFINDSSPIVDISQNPIFSYQSQVNDKQLLLLMLTKAEIAQMAAPVTQTAQQVISAIGEDFYSCSHFDFTINSSCDDMLDKNLAQNLMKGFSAKFYNETNQDALGKLRKFAEKSQAEVPAMIKLLTLIRSKKFHLKLRSPKQMQIFLNKMGISEAVEGLPCLADLLEEISGTCQETVNSHPLMKVGHQISRFALKNVENNVQIYMLLGPIGTVKMSLSAKNITRVHSILFNEA